MMIASSAIAVVVLLQSASTAPGPGQRLAEDPLIGTALAPQTPDVTSLHVQVRQEGRDDVWASHIEAALRTRYADSTALHALQQPVRVVCGATLCEVAGTLSPAADKRRLNLIMEALQGADLRRDAGKLGLTSESISFGTPPGRPDGMVFVTYYKRAVAPT